MAFRLDIDTDNAAFSDCPAIEIVRILRLVADSIENGEGGEGGEGAVLGLNDNEVAAYSFSHD